MPHYTIPFDNMHGYAVKFSPYIQNRLAVVASQLYGNIGPGALLILNCLETENVIKERCFHWRDGLFNTVWSKDNSCHVVTSSGDGSLQLWDTTSEEEKPVQIFKEHTAEVYAIDWATINQNPQILSGGWDGKLKLWDPTRKNSLISFEHSIDNGHKNLVSSVGTDCYLSIWNLNDINPVFHIKTSASEILTCDWMEKSEHMIGVGLNNGNICIYDLRNTKKEYVCLKSETDAAIRKIKFSPFDSATLVSVGYDSITRLWDYTVSNEPLYAICQNNDCVCGVDWDTCCRNKIVTCGWDSNINIFNFKTGMERF